MHGDRVSERAPQCTGVLTAGVRVPLVCQSETEGARKEGEGMESGCGGGGWGGEERGRVDVVVVGGEERKEGEGQESGCGGGGLSLIHI